MVDQAENLRRMMAEKKEAARADMTSRRGTRQKVFAVASGKGGVGKTSLSVNMGISMCRKGKNVLVLDCDLGLSNVNIVMGEIPKYNLYHVLKGEKQLSEIIYKTRYGVDIIAGASGFNELANMIESERNSFIEQLGFLTQYDCIILDAGAGISTAVTSFLYAADKIIIVTTPEPTAVTDAYGIIKVLASESRNLDINLVVNRIDSIAEGRKVAERIISIAQQYLRVTVRNIGLIYRDSIVEKALYQRTPFLVFDEKAKSSIAVEAVAARLLNLPVSENQSGIKSFFTNLFK